MVENLQIKFHKFGPWSRVPDQMSLIQSPWPNVAASFRRTCAKFSGKFNCGTFLHNIPNELCFYLCIIIRSTLPKIFLLFLKRVTFLMAIRTTGSGGGLKQQTPSVCVLPDSHFHHLSSIARLLTTDIHILCEPYPYCCWHKKKKIKRQR